MFTCPEVSGEACVYLPEVSGKAYVYLPKSERFSRARERISHNFNQVIRKTLYSLCFFTPRSADEILLSRDHACYISSVK